MEKSCFFWASVAWQHQHLLRLEADIVMDSITPTTDDPAGLALDNGDLLAIFCTFETYRCLYPQDTFQTGLHPAFSMARHLPFGLSTWR
jgi:hypothetical protein